MARLEQKKGLPLYEESTAFEQTSDQVWEAIRNFGCFAWVESSPLEDAKAGGAVGGIGHLRQRLLAHSDLDQSSTYAFCDSVPILGRNTQATLESMMRYQTKIKRRKVMQRPFRFGVLCEEMGDREAWLAKARRAEELGYATLLLRDHFLPGTFGDQFAPLSALMAAAMVTSRLRIGSMVFDNDYRHPVVLGKEVATLDVLSGGRFEFGLGAGWMGSEYEQAGLSFDPPATRIDRFEEALQIFKGLFASEPFTFAGKHYRITGLQNFPVPVQRPRPPILIGAGGRRMLTIAAREANIVGILAGPLNAGLPSPNDPAAYSPQRLAQKIAWLREAAGERFTQLELSVVTTPVFTDNRRQGAEQVAQRRGWSGIAVEEILEMPTIFVGTVEQIAEQMLERRERFGISYYMTLDHSMEASAPLVEQLSGR